MGKKREDRGKEKTLTDRECNLDGQYVSPLGSYRDFSFETIRNLLCHSRYFQILLSLTIIGFFLRFYNLGFNSLWLDEASTLTFALKTIPDIWQATTAGEFNPPLFYWIEHLMLTFGNNEVILRFVPAILGALTIPLFYLIGKEFIDRNVGIIAAAACTFSPFLIYYSQEARAYSMMLFFIACAAFVFLKALKTNDMTHWALFSVFSALAFWSHFYAMVLIGALVLYALFELLPKIRNDIYSLKPIIAGGALFIFLCLPLIVVTIQLFAKRTASAPTFGIQGIGLVIETFRQILTSPFTTPGSDIVFFILLILFILGIIQAFLLDKSKGIFLVSLTILPFVISFYLSFRIPMQPRYLIFLSLILYLGIAVSYKLIFSLVANRAVVYGFVILLFLMSAPVLAIYYSGFSKEDWRGFSGQVSQFTSPGDFIVVAPGYIYQPFDFYYSNRSDGTLELHADNGKDLESIRLQKGNNSMFLVVTGDIASANPDGDALAWIKEHAQPAVQNTGIYLFKVN